MPSVAVRRRLSHSRPPAVLLQARPQHPGAERRAQPPDRRDSHGPHPPPAFPAHHRAAGPDIVGAARRRSTHVRRPRAAREHRLLGRYTDRHGHAREVIASHGAAGSTLVVDRHRATHGDPRLVAHLAADEPAENAALVCALYLRDAVAGGSRDKPSGFVPNPTNGPRSLDPRQGQSP